MTQLLQASIIISITLIFYRTLLEKETHYRLNRWILLVCILVAFILPQVPLKIPIPIDLPSSADISLPFTKKEIVYTPAWEPIDIPKEEEELLTQTQELSLLEKEPIRQESQQTGMSSLLQSFTFQELLLYVYLIGVIAMSIHFLMQLFSLVHQIKIHPRSKDGKYVLVELSKGKASYSFFNFIFINPQPLDDSTYQQILSHERIHVDQKHSIDILLSQILLISQWFNPFAWMYKKKVKQNLEYLTDDLMVKKGADITDYQFSLLRVSAPALSGQLVLNYSQSLLKKRILMMNAKKSSLSSTWKYLFLVPVLALSSLILIAEKTPAPLLYPEQTSISEEQLTPAVESEQEEIPTETQLEHEVISTDFETDLPAISQSFLSTEEISGSWEAKIKEGEVCLRILRSISGEDWNWMHHDCYEEGEFSPKVSSSTTAFSMKRKSGSVNFTGSFSGIKGEGKFTFTGNDSYRKELAGKGINNASDDILFRLFFVRDEKKYLENLVALTKLGLDENTLQTLMVDGVKADLVKGYQDEGLSVSEHLKFVRSRVKAPLIKSYKDAGLDLKEHEGFVNSRVKPDLLMGYKEAGLDLEKHKSFIHSRVKPGLLADYRKAGLDLEEHKGYINSRVKPDLLKAYKDAGFDLEEYKSYIHSRVKPDLLTAYKDAGFPPAEYKSYIHSRVKPELLKSYKDAGLDLTENNHYIQSRVKPEVLKEYKEAGYDLEEYASYIQSRVKPSLLKSYEDAGYDLKKYNSYIQSRVKPDMLKAYEAAGFAPDTYRHYIHSRVKPELLKSYKDAGLDLDAHKSYIHSRVDPKMLKAYKDAGFDLKTHDKYIHSRVKPEFLKAYKDAGLDLKKYNKYIHSRVSADFLSSYIKEGYDPASYSDFIHRRIKASLLKKYQDAGLDINEHKDFIMDRVDPEKVKKYRDAQKNNN